MLFSKAIWEWYNKTFISQNIITFKSSQRDGLFNQYMPWFIHLNNESWNCCCSHSLPASETWKNTKKTSISLLCLLLSFSARSQFAVDVQTTSSRGLVFYAGTKNSFMALYLSKGRLVFALGAEGKKLKLKSKEKCSDGKWHTVRAGAAVELPAGAEFTVE